MRLTFISLTALAASLLITGAAETARGPDPAAVPTRMWSASREQTGALLLMAPLHLLWAACGILGGLALRDRVPITRSHSSPTAAWLAKRAIAGSAVLASAFALGSLRVDPAWLHGVAVLHALGWLAYLRNLPARL
jgi:hypothetical protein